MRSVNALGFIEMYGLVGCIEAADAMVKSANVSLVQHGEISAGLVTVVVEGDVAACQAAVNAGVASVLAQFVQSTEGSVFSEEELNKTIQYIATHEKGLAWKEISKHFPQHSKQLQQKLDGLVASGKLTKTGSRYGKPK